jgi:high-affinity K+ transport system ATPase subunit B
MFSKTIITALAGIATVTGAKFGYTVNAETMVYAGTVFVLASQIFARLGLKRAENASKEASKLLKEIQEELKSKAQNETITNRPNDAGVNSLHQGKF